MGLESVTYVSDLVSTNPVVSDDVAQGDDHIRALKSALRTTFPNADKAFYFPDFGTKSADFTIVATDLNKTFLVDTSGGNVIATLPALTSADDGWSCHFMKSGTDTNAIFRASRRLEGRSLGYEVRLFGRAPLGSAQGPRAPRLAPFKILMERASPLVTNGRTVRRFRGPLVRSILTTTPERVHSLRVT